MPTDTEVIEAEVREPEPIRAVAQPGQAIVAETGSPSAMVEKATAIADALSDIVERKRLYATISGRKFPQVEAWMTIGRMDNVVAREASRPIANEDGSWEAEVELVRLSDGMVIGNASAMCGAPGDKPWDSRPTHQRRSMAVTRATSRAFRQQYSWIMALAGYEPTPADEMAQDEPQQRALEPDHDGSLIGKVAKGKSPVDYELRQTPDGMMCGFALTEGRQKLQVVAVGPLGEALHPFLEGLTGSTVKVWGSIGMVDWEKDGRKMPPYRRVTLSKIATPDFILPAPESATVAGDVQIGSIVEAPSEELFTLTDDEAAEVAGPYA